MKDVELKTYLVDSKKDIIMVKDAFDLEYTAGKDKLFIGSDGKYYCDFLIPEYEKNLENHKYIGKDKYTKYLLEKMKEVIKKKYEQSKNRAY